jgi:hypothetical protein
MSILRPVASRKNQAPPRGGRYTLSMKTFLLKRYFWLGVCLHKDCSAIPMHTLNWRATHPSMRITSHGKFLPSLQNVIAISRPKNHARTRRESPKADREKQRRITKLVAAMVYPLLHPITSQLVQQYFGLRDRATSHVGQHLTMVPK